MNGKINKKAAMPPRFYAKIAQGSADIQAAQRLRYDVFVTELGADGPLVDHAARYERDRFDAFATHILLCDDTRPVNDQVVGVYRVMTTKDAMAAGQFYCEDEYDLTKLRQSGLGLLELGRSCLHPDYRGGAGMLHLWSALADYVAQHRIDLVFGVASFHGTDVAALQGALGLLHHRHLAPAHLRVTAKGPTALPMNTLPEARIDRLAAVRSMPALIKAYLRLGATVGEGAFVDHAFNTVDICLILQSNAINALQHSIYTKGEPLG